MKDLHKTLTELGLSATTARVYYALIGAQKSSAKQIATSAGIPRPSVYDHLKELGRLGLVSELEIENKKYFQIDDPNRLEQLVEEKIQTLILEKARVKKLLPEMRKGVVGTEARMKFFEGIDGFRRVLTDILWQDEDELLIVWPFAEMTELAGEEYLESWTRRRVAQGIHIRSVWPFDKKLSGKKIPDEETRFAPKDMHWSMGYIICGDKVYFISSRNEAFSFVVHSHDFAELMFVQFESIWRQSK